MAGGVHNVLKVNSAEEKRLEVEARIFGVMTWQSLKNFLLFLVLFSVCWKTILDQQQKRRFCLV